jgi:hypothetical protein
VNGAKDIHIEAVSGYREEESTYIYMQDRGDYISRLLNWNVRYANARTTYVWHGMAKLSIIAHMKMQPNRVGIASPRWTLNQTRFRQDKLHDSFVHV